MREILRLRLGLPAAFRRVVEHIPDGQLLRYIGVGIWNSLFGYASFAVLTYLLEPPFPRTGYIIAGVVSSVINITVAFLAYKFFVFKSTGSIVLEWLRCMVVYSSGIVLCMVLLPLFVYALRHATRIDEGAPYLAGATLVCLNAVYNFIGNRQYTFKRARVERGYGRE